MKAFVCSDLHLEHKNHDIEYLKTLLPESTDDYDIAFFAGDIVCYGMKGWSKCIEYINSQFDKVVITDGNHEFYNVKNKSKWYIDVDWAAQYLLFNDSISSISGNMWYDIHIMNDAIDYLNDFELIYSGNKNDIVRDMIGCHNEFFETVIYFLCNSNKHKYVVMTHQSPCKKSTIDNELAPLFYSKDAEFILNRYNKKIPLWIHGHTHLPVDYYVGNTRVISNPCGYPHEKVDYDRNYMIKI